MHTYQVSTPSNNIATGSKRYMPMKYDSHTNNICHNICINIPYNIYVCMYMVVYATLMYIHTYIDISYLNVKRCFILGSFFVFLLLPAVFVGLQYLVAVFFFVVVFPSCNPIK